MKSIAVKTGDNSYSIVICENFSALSEEMKKIGVDKCYFVTDSNVSPLYYENVRLCLESGGISVLGKSTIRAGEGSKNIDVLKNILGDFLLNELDRKSIVVALGGGVVGDMTGFASAIYMRGIKYIQIPTTLLAQTDSSVGGKTGIDFFGAKNIIGAFKQPELVYINTSVLKTLPMREFYAGMAEVIKYGLICDKAFLGFLYDNANAVKVLKTDVITEMICRCIMHKARIVSDDEKENGIRAILNFGHTIGHGVESVSEFNYLHGECVALGMRCALRIAYERGLIDLESMKFAYELFARYSLAERCKIESADEVVDAMKKDKKNVNGQIRFILTNGIGNANIYKDVSEREIRSSIEYIIDRG